LPKKKIKFGPFLIVLGFSIVAGLGVYLVSLGDGSDGGNGNGNGSLVRFVGTIENANSIGFAIDSMADTCEYYQGRTYFAFMDANLQCYISCFDHSAKSWSSKVFLGTSSQYHGSPALLVLDNGKIVVFYSCHSGGFKYRISTFMGDISSWGSEKSVFNYATYPHPIQLSNGEVWLFAMHGTSYDHGKLVRVISTDRCNTFGPIQSIIDLEGDTICYVSSIRVGTNGFVHIFFSIYDGSAGSGSLTDIYYMCYDPFDARWEKVDGNPISLPATLSSVDKVFESGSTFTFPCDLKLDSHNDVYILFTHGSYYKLAKHEGGTWQVYDITGGVNDNRDNGRLRFDGTTLYAYLTVNGTYPGGEEPLRGGEIGRYKSVDGGCTWILDWKITESSSLNNIDLRVPLNGERDLQCIWHYGTPSRTISCELKYCGERPRSIIFDVNGDGVVNILDVKLVKLAYSGLINESMADLDGNGKIDILDVKLVKLAYSGFL